MKRIEYKTVWQAAVASWDSGGYGGAPPVQPDKFISLLGHTPTTCFTTCLTWMGGRPHPPFPTSWIRHCGSLDNVQRKSRQLFVLKVYLLREIQNLRIFKNNGGGRQRDNFSFSPPPLLFGGVTDDPYGGDCNTMFVEDLTRTFYSVHYTKFTATSRP